MEISTLFCGIKIFFLLDSRPQLLELLPHFIPLVVFFPCISISFSLASWISVSSHTARLFAILDTQNTRKLFSRLFVICRLSKSRKTATPRFSAGQSFVITYDQLLVIHGALGVAAFLTACRSWLPTRPMINRLMIDLLMSFSRTEN